jgi:ankyrin repeat domain-containing protein 50
VGDAINHINTIVLSVTISTCQSCVDEGKRCGYKGHPSFKQFNSFIVHITAVEEDLLTYVQWRIASSDFLKQCVELKEGLMTDIIDTVVKANGGMFLLAKFNMDTLASKLRPGEVATALRALPKELDGTYTDAMLRICDLPSNQKEVVMEFLCWVVFAEQPLQISEIEHAIAVSESDRDIDHDNIVRAPVLASMCAGLVQFDESDCVRLVHYSAENFFRQNWDRWFPEGSRKLTSTCLTYLLFEPFKDGACSGPSESADFDDRLEKYPFLSYTAKNWGKHLLQTPQDDLYDKARRLLTDAGYLATSTQALWYLEDEDSTSWAGKNGSSALHLATHFGLDKLVAELLDQGVDPNTKDANGATPLALAAERGIVDVAKTLIQAGASVNAVDNIGAAPLHEAAEHDQEEIVKLLLEQKDINVNISHSRRMQYTPLMLAALYGYTGVVKLLLSMPQLEINKCWSDPQGMTALMLAACNNELEVVETLLTHPGIDIDYQEPRGSTALIYAAEGGYADIVEALLDHGANTEVLQKDTEGTALLRAIDENSIPVVELLLRRGANVHHKDCFGRGMLHGAACNGRTEIIRILLDFDKTLDVNMRDVSGKTTLHDVARLGYEETAATLLEYG